MFPLPHINIIYLVVIAEGMAGLLASELPCLTKASGESRLKAHLLVARDALDLARVDPLSRGFFSSYPSSSPNQRRNRGRRD